MVEKLAPLFSEVDTQIRDEWFRDLPAPAMQPLVDVLASNGPPRLLHHVLHIWAWERKSTMSVSGADPRIVPHLLHIVRDSIGEPESGDRDLRPNTEDPWACRAWREEKVGVQSHALGILGTHIQCANGDVTDCLEAVLFCLKSQEPEIRQEAYRGLFSTIMSRVPLPLRDRIGPPVLEAFKSETDRWAIPTACLILTHLEEPRALELFEELETRQPLFETSSSRLRSELDADEIAEIERDLRISLFVAKSNLKDRLEKGRARRKPAIDEPDTAVTPSQQETPRAWPELVDMLNSDDTGERVKAIDELATAGHPDAGTRLVELLDDPSHRVKVAAVNSLRQLGSPEFGGALLQRFSESVTSDFVAQPGEAQLQILLAQTLGQLRIVEAREVLADTTHSQSKSLQAAAVIALTQLGDDRGVIELARILRSYDYEAVTAVVAEAERVSRESPETPPVDWTLHPEILDAIDHQLARDPAGYVAACMARMLYGTASTHGQDLLRSLLPHFDVDVRCSALNSLLATNVPDRFPLIESAMNDRISFCRQTAIDWLQKIDWEHDPKVTPRPAASDISELAITNLEDLGATELLEALSLKNEAVRKRVLEVLNDRYQQPDLNIDLERRIRRTLARMQADEFAP